MRQGEITRKPLYIRVSDGQEVFGLSRATFYRAAKRGEIVIYKKGGASFLEVAAIERWLKSEAA